MAALTLPKHAVLPNTDTVGYLGLAPNELATLFTVPHNEPLILSHLRLLLKMSFLIYVIINRLQHLPQQSVWREGVLFYPEI